MPRYFATLILAAFLLMTAAYADTMPVAGSTSGTFSNPTGGSSVSGNQWKYNGSNGFVEFDGVSFLGTTTASVELGSITLTNTSSQPNGTFTAGLNLNLNFTTPAGQQANFTDGLQVIAKSGGGNSGHGDDLNLIFSGFPGPQSFTLGNEIYTVTYDGFFNSPTNENTPVTSLFVENNPGGAATAYLWGTITTAPTRGTTSPVPEPGSVVLLLTVIGGSALSLRRKYLCR